MTVLTVQVEANGDDGHRTWDEGLSDWSFVNNGNSVYLGSENSGMEATSTTCYFRFLDVDIPASATINSAKLQYKLGASYSYSSKSCRIYADARSASSAAIASDGNLSGAQGSMTTDYATWNLSTSSSTSFLDSADFTDVIDEVINTAGWDASSNNITILLYNPTDADMMDSWVLDIKAHEVSSGADAVKLVIDYTEASEGAATSEAFLLFVD